MPAFTWQPREQRKPLKGEEAGPRCSHWEDRRERGAGGEGGGGDRWDSGMKRRRESVRYRETGTSETGRRRGDICSFSGDDSFTYAFFFKVWSIRRSLEFMNEAEEGRKVSKWKLCTPLLVTWKNNCYIRAHNSKTHTEHKVPEHFCGSVRIVLMTHLSFRTNKPSALTSSQFDTQNLQSESRTSWKLCGFSAFHPHFLSVCMQP